MCNIFHIVFAETNKGNGCGTGGLVGKAMEPYEVDVGKNEKKIFITAMEPFSETHRRTGVIAIYRILL